MNPILNRIAAAAFVAASPVVLQAADTPATAPSVTTEKPNKIMPEVPSDLNAPPADAAKTDSGLISKVLTPGSGKSKPTAADTVTVHYSGWSLDGKMFDSSVERGEPTSFPLSGVIAGWTEGLQLMVEGEKRRFWIPAELAYGENPGSGRPGGQLVFDVELLKIKQAPKPPEDTEKTADGTAYKVLSKGNGDTKPQPSDMVTFQFVGKTMEGQTVQDTTTQPTPPSVGLDRLSPALRESLSDMVTGEKRRCWLPESQVPGGFVVADLELISFKKAPPAPAVPEDVAAAPDDAKKTDSGLASKVITAGKGKDKPKESDTVRVHYSGWTTDGKMFDSSVTRGEPTQFPLSGVIAGWTEGLQLMVEGEKRRFWIPAALAYGDNPQGGAPSGLLVFDVELLEIVR